MERIGVILMAGSHCPLGIVTNALNHGFEAIGPLARQGRAQAKPRKGVLWVQSQYGLWRLTRIELKH